MKYSRKHIMPLLLIVLFVGGSQSPAWSFPFSSDTVRFERAKDHFRKGMIHFNKRQYLAAVEFFRNAVSAYPDYHTAREFLARSYRFAGFADEALREWESLLDLNPGNVAIRSKIDTLRFRKGGGGGEERPDDLVMSGEIVSELLTGYRFPNPVDCAVDEDKNVYITSFSLGKIVKIDPNGKGIASHAPTLKSKLFGIDYRKGKIAVTDFARDRVYVLTKSFQTLFSFGGSGNTDGLFHGPEGVCFDSAGNIYVVDSGNTRVQKFDQKGNLILKFGEEGDYEGKLDSPTDAVVESNIVYVSDTGNKRIALFDDSGNFIKNITLPRMSKPRGLSFKSPYLLVSDEERGLLFYDTVKETGEWFTEWHNGERKFGSLYASVYDRDGVLISLDYAHQRAMFFTPPKMQYTNLDIEITSVDTRQYPVVAVYCNVRGRGGSPVLGLKKENFRITEDGMNVSRLSVDYLKSLHPSASIVLCVDRSKSAAAHHEEVPWASEFILSRMRTNDSVKIMNFNRDFWTGNDFDWSRRRALKALAEKEYRHESDFGNVLYNAVYDLVPKLDRRAVVMFTDGSDTSFSFKKYSPDYIINFAKSHYVPVYVVTFKNIHPELARIARETGGAHVRSSDVEGLRGLYDKIRNAEEYRYLIMYRSYKLPAFRGWWSDLHISVDYRGQKGLEWGGYFAPSK